MTNVCQEEGLLGYEVEAGEEVSSKRKFTEMSQPSHWIDLHDVRKLSSKLKAKLMGKRFEEKKVPESVVVPKANVIIIVSDDDGDDVNEVVGDTMDIVVAETDDEIDSNMENQLSNVKQSGNVGKKVKEHLAAEEIEKMVEGMENEDTYKFVNSILDNQNDPGTRLDPKSYKEIPEVEITAVVQPVNVIEEEDKSAKDDYDLRRMVKGKHVEESRHTSSPIAIRSHRIHSTLISSDTEKLQELTVTDPTLSSFTPSLSSSKPSSSIKPSYSLQSKTRCFKGYKIFFEQIKGRYGYLSGHLKTAFMPRKSFHELANHLQEVMQESLPSIQKMQAEVAQIVADAIQKERENLLAKITSQINNAISNHIPSQVDSSVRSYMSNHVLHVHPTQASKIKFEGLTATNTLCRSYVIRLRDQDDHHDDAHPDGENKMDKYAIDDDKLLAEKVSQELVEEMAKIVDEAKLRKVVDKYVKKFNPYAQYNVEHWKNLHAKIFYIKRQKEPGKPIVEVYSNSKIVQVIKTIVELGHEHKFETEIIMTPETGLLWLLSVFITSTVIWERVYDFQLGLESYQHNVDLTVPTITFLSMKKKKRFSIITEPIHGIIYKNNKKEKRMMGHHEIHKFFDATLKRVLEGLKSYNNDVKHGYVTPSLNKEDVEYLQLFEEEIEERLKHRDQMRRWEMYVNGRQLASRREHLV
ncbi:hypothetical protein Tco_0804822 [Tanacetum coccineum]|uniref:Uncharacterized protein n=1 Tax=Tanacetum coccineum TaxID=301880 RepID=A0ABQ5A5C9_9ASTR